jgi:hypothetical protein
LKQLKISFTCFTNYDFLLRKEVIEGKTMMKLKLTALALFTLFPCISYGDQTVDLDSPEGWAMAFMTASAQNLGQSPPHSVNLRDISISAELSSIPRLTKARWGAIYPSVVTRLPIGPCLRSASTAISHGRMDKSLADDLNMPPGTVSSRVALLLRAHLFCLKPQFRLYDSTRVLSSLHSPAGKPD